MTDDVDDEAVFNDEKVRVRGGRGAGVIGEDAQAPSDRKVGLDEGGILRQINDAVFLISARKKNLPLVQRMSVDVAYETVAVVFFLTLRAAVAGHGGR